MDSQGLIDRRRLRRKLGFWRIATLVTVLALVAGLVASNLPKTTRTDHIARITVSGLIQDDERLVDLIKAAGESAFAKALVVSISTPGGTTYGGERLHKALVEVGKVKPVVAEVRTLAASAGYMIAASTDHIIAGESSIVGSIGVIFQYVQAGELLDKIGVRVDEIKSAPLKAEPSPFHEASPEAKAMIRSMVLDSFDWFVDLVADRRKMDRAQVLALADGSIFTGRQGLANGLVDELGGENEIRAYLKTRDIDSDLDIIDWEVQTEARGILFSQAAPALIEYLTGLPSDVSGKLIRLGDGNLFLDGLLSVWQFGGDGTRDN